ncbi:MAG: PAS domain S-box protein [Burkholderiales bacterium]|nr:PAS domain S-box protein [Burkholderiales bacterium]
MQPSSLPPAAPPQALDASVFRSVFDAYPDAVLLIDAAGSIVLANGAAAQLLGYSGAQLLGMSVEALVPPAVVARHQGLRQGYAQAPRTRLMGGDVELAAHRADGSEVMVEISLSPLQSGAANFVVAALRGIGAYPRVQRALQRARYNEHLALAGRSAVDMRDPQQLMAHVAALAAQGLEVEAVSFWLLEPNRLEFRAASSFAAAADAAVRAVALSATDAPVPNRPDTLLGLVAAQGAALIVSSFARESRFNVSPALRQGPLQAALAVPMIDAQRVIGVLVADSVKPGRFGEDEKHFVESLANLVVTSLQRAQTEAQLGHAQRLEAVGQLTGGIAHDFNNLLTIMQGNLQMLADHPGVAGDSHLSLMVNSAARAGQRGAELTGKLLAFSRRQALATTAVDTGALLKAMAEMLRRTLGRHVNVALHIHAGCPRCLADAGQLESALLNIALNSRDAMPAGGTLSFSCAPCSEVPSEMRAASGARSNPATAATECVAIEITDTGIGMSREVLDHAFEPFFTTKEPGKGTGLGLSTVYGFVKQSGGHLQVQSKPGAGTSILLFLPAAPAVAAAEAGAAAPAVRASSAPEAAIAPGLAPASDAAAGAALLGRRVLIVEDDAEVRRVAIAFFAAMGATARAVADAESAIAELERGSECDLLFSDITLGAGMNGIELAQSAHAFAPGLAVLLTSGYSEYLTSESPHKPQLWPVLRKPYTREELAQAAHRVLQGAAHPAATAARVRSAPKRPA